MTQLVQRSSVSGLAPRCHVCGEASLALQSAFSQLRRVTSDSKPWCSGGQLARCTSCGVVQAVVDEGWREQARQIYASYSVYHVAGGADQGVMAVDRGLQPRSEILAARLAELGVLPPSGLMLDIGCGNGAFLRTVGERFAGWQLWGLEWDDRHRALIEAIPGVVGFHQGELGALGRRFDLISLVHVLEHLENPAEYLRRLSEHLNPDGLLLIEVPDCTVNPFALLIADHATHFSLETLAELVAAQGLEVVCATRAWVSRELSLVARKASSSPRPLQPQPTSMEVVRGVTWLVDVRQQARALAQGASWGIFGTSIAAAFVDQETGETARFFVDEDPARVGKTFLGRPVLAPSQVEPGQVVFVALAAAVADQVIARIRGAGVTYVSPPKSASLGSESASLRRGESQGVAG
jgi:2-polyprenyl-3-methyl-5-hydroxy-6-metoxy-1,4-benzoquinol methylase